MESTTNLKLPLLVSNQSQKEVTHNEALTIIDNILQNGIINKDLTTPPTSPNSNDLYIVGTSATDDWEEQDGHLAYYDNGWRFIEPREGTTFWVNDEDCLYTYNGSTWEKTLETISSTIEDLNDLSDVSITSASQYDLLQHNGTNFVNTKEIQNLSLVGINTTADSTNKLSIKSDAVLFDKATANSQIKVNKASSTDTASHLFQTGYSGRAEFGLTGSDDFTLKVSSDGSTWNNAFVVAKATGNIDFKGTITNNGSGIMPMPVNTSGVVGRLYRIEGGSGVALTLPSGGTWAILVAFSVNSSTAVVYMYGADAPSSLVVAGGTTIMPARSGYAQEAYVMRIA